MPRYTKEQRKYHLQIVRQAMIRVETEAKYPSCTAIQQELEVMQAPIIFTEPYILHLREAVWADRAKRIDKAVLSIDIAKIEDRFIELKSRLYSILNSEVSTPKEKIMAAKVIADMEKALIDIKFDSGVFKRNIGTLDLESPAAILIGKVMENGRRQVRSDSRFISRLHGDNVQDQPLSLPTPNSGKNTTDDSVSVVSDDRQPG